MKPFATFVLEGLPFALPLDRAIRAVRAVAVLPLPRAPEIVSGVINLQGRVIPVVNLRGRLGLRDREPGPDDHLLIARSSRRVLAMIVDAATGVVEAEERDFVPVESIVGGTSYVEGILKGPTGMLLIQDLDRFLSLPEEKSLEAALSSAAEAS